MNHLQLTWLQANGIALNTPTRNSIPSPLTNGGTGSGDFDHEGRPGEIGGSSKSKGQPRAKVGGEIGLNGEWYKGGAFIATTDLPKKIKDKIKKSASGKVNTGEGWIVPEPGKMSLFAKLVGTYSDRNGNLNHQFMEYQRLKPDEIKMYEELAQKLKSGEKWVSVEDYPTIANYDDISRLAIAGKAIPGAAIDKFPADVKSHFTKFKPTTNFSTIATINSSSISPKRYKRGKLVKGRVSAKNLTRIDPTRTIDLRRRFGIALRKALSTLKTRIRIKIDHQDCFGLKNLIGNVGPEDEPRDDKGRWTSGGGGDSGESSKVGAVQRHILDEAAKIEHTDENVSESVNERDYDTIRNAMTESEYQKMKSALEKGKNSWVEEQVKKEMERFPPVITDKMIAKESGITDEDIYKRVTWLLDPKRGLTLIGDSTRLSAISVEDERDRLGDVVDEWRNDNWGGGPNSVINLQNKMVAANAHEDVLKALSEYKEEVQESYKKAKQEIEDENREDLVQEFENKFDMSKAETDYLDKYYQNNIDKFGKKLDIWGKNNDGFSIYNFAAPNGQEYQILSMKRREFGFTGSDISFESIEHGYGITGSGSAHAVFGKVVPAIVSFMDKQDVKIATFTAAEPSRHKLYDRLVKTVAKVMPEFSAIALVREGTKRYICAKRDQMQEIKEKIRDERHIEPDVLINTEVLVNTIAYQDVSPEIDPSWWTSQAWSIAANFDRRSTSPVWGFYKNTDKAKEWRQWLKSQTNELLKSSDKENLWKSFIKDSMTKGIGRTFDDVQSRRQGGGRYGGGTSPEFYAGSKRQFIETTLGRTESYDTLDLLAQRTFTDLDGITSAMDAKMHRVLIDGLLKGDSSAQIAHDLNEQVDSIGINRANAIAHTEIIRAHAEGQLMAMEALNVDEVGVLVEFTATDDNLLCPECAEMEGMILDVEDAHGIIPVHPYCRCAWIPVNDRDD